MFLWSTPRRFCALGIVLVLLLGSVVQSLAQTPGPQRDVLLLLDNSGSMDGSVIPGKNNDPLDWRFIVASVVVNYLGVSADYAGTYRLGLISYAQSAVTLSPVVEINETNRLSLAQMLDVRMMGNINRSYTNHDLALQQAVNELRNNPNPDARRPPVVVLLTDGALEENTSGLSRELYVEKMGGLISELKGQGAILYVVLLVGPGRILVPEVDRQLWKRWAQSASGGVIEVEDPADFHESYVQVINLVVGAISRPTPGLGRLPPVEAGQRKVREFTLQFDPNELPYLDSLIVTVAQSIPDFSVSFVRPDGRELLPIPDEVDVRQSRYAAVWRINCTLLQEQQRWVDENVGEGQPQTWKVVLAAGSREGQVSIFVSDMTPRIELQSPSSTQVLRRNQSVEIEARLLNRREGIIPIAPDVAPKVQINIEKPNGSVVRGYMQPEEEDILRYTFEDADQEGEYRISFQATLSLSDGTSRTLVAPGEGVAATMAVANTPAIASVEVDPDASLEPQEPFSIRARVIGADDQAQLEAWAEILSITMGRTITRTIMERTQTGEFASPAVRLDASGVYTVSVYLKGMTAEGVAYGPGASLPPFQESTSLEITLTPVTIQDISVQPQVVRGQSALITVTVRAEQPVSQLSMFAEIPEAESPEVQLQDDGRPPDRRAGDGAYTAYLPPLSSTGTAEVRVRLEGQSRFGVPLVDEKTASLVVIPSPLERFLRWFVPTFGATALAAAVVVYVLSERRKAPLTGTLRVVYPTALRTRRNEFSLDTLGTKRATLGILAGAIPLPAPSDAATPGIKARLSGRWERDEIAGRTIRVYVERTGRAEVSLNGEPLRRGRSYLLFDGGTIELEGLIVDYVAPPQSGSNW